MRPFWRLADCRLSVSRSWLPKSPAPTRTEVKCQTTNQLEIARNDNRRSGSVGVVVVPILHNIRSEDPVVPSLLAGFEFEPFWGPGGCTPPGLAGPFDSRTDDERRSPLRLRRAHRRPSRLSHMPLAGLSAAYGTTRDTPPSNVASATAPTLACSAGAKWAMCAAACA